MFNIGICVFFLYSLSSIRGERIIEDDPFDVLTKGTLSAGDMRIVGGQVAQDRTHFPYQVSLRDNRNRPFCGASIVDDRHLLTAAHCVTNNDGAAVTASSIRAVMGDLSTLTPTNNTITRQIEHIFVHENYNATTVQHDIAVLRIANITFNQFVNRIDIANGIPPVGTTCVVSGWGTIFSDGPPSISLRYVFVPIVSTAACNQAYGNAILPGMFCAGYYGRDACQGDSGGPLVCVTGQIGVVSFGKGCGDPEFPGVYADATFYNAWMRTQFTRDSGISVLFNKYLFVFIIIAHIFTKIAL